MSPLPQSCGGGGGGGIRGEGYGGGGRGGGGEQRKRSNTRQSRLEVKLYFSRCSQRFHLSSVTASD